MSPKCDLHDELMEDVKEKFTAIFNKFEKYDEKWTKFMIVLIIIAFLAGINTFKGVADLVIKLSNLG